MVKRYKMRGSIENQPRAVIASRGIISSVLRNQQEEEQSDYGYLRKWENRKEKKGEGERRTSKTGAQIQVLVRLFLVLLLILLLVVFSTHISSGA
jgi:hypothetical protein